jgi:transcriptional regulator with XRE-family HTH domain
MVGKTGKRARPELHRLRKAAGLSQAAIAKRVGVTQAMISKLESGENEPGGLRAAHAIAAVFGCDVFDIWPHLRPVVGRGAGHNPPTTSVAGRRRKTSPAAGTRRKRTNETG